MLNWMVTFFLLAVAAFFLGFFGLKGSFAAIAQFLSLIFVILFVASIVHSLIIDQAPHHRT